MRTNVILYNAETDKTHFTLRKGKRPWGILLAISKGSFRLSFPQSRQSFVISPYEIAYVPPNTEFCREVIEAIDFHQFAFQICDDAHPLAAPRAGKLSIPREQVKCILESADKISSFSSETDLLAEHILHRILVESHLFSSNSEPTHMSREISAAIDYIHQNLHLPLSASMLAEKLHLSHNGLIWKFKKELNTTPLGYVTMCRIRRTKKLLFDSDLSISRIAEECGYANSYYFSNAFKKNEGISPSEFRKKCIK